MGHEVVGGFGAALSEGLRRHHHAPPELLRFRHQLYAARHGLALAQRHH
jgi:hypothetical protein